MLFDQLVMAEQVTELNKDDEARRALAIIDTMKGNSSIQRDSEDGAAPQALKVR